MTTASMLGFGDVIETVDSLAGLYREPGRGALDKVTDRLDEGCRQFIAASTMVLVGSADTEGNQDVSPRGGPAGFVRVLDEDRLVIPDLNGNNRLDSLRNIVVNGRVALLFLVPGLGETLRMNGQACVTTDPAVLDLFTDQLRRPVSAIGVRVGEAYIHCAKSLRRAGLWDPETWVATGARPPVGQILVAHSGSEGKVTAEQVEAGLEGAYTKGLAADLPE
jgi:PPOX class probable FMN-dependent enzyme